MLRDQPIVDLYYSIQARQLQGNANADRWSLVGTAVNPPADQSLHSSGQYWSRSPVVGTRRPPMMAKAVEQSHRVIFFFFETPLPKILALLSTCVCDPMRLTTLNKWLGFPRQTYPLHLVDYLAVELLFWLNISASSM